MRDGGPVDAGRRAVSAVRTALLGSPCGSRACTGCSKATSHGHGSELPPRHHESDAVGNAGQIDGLPHVLTLNPRADRRTLHTPTELPRCRRATDSPPAPRSHPSRSPVGQSTEHPGYGLPPRQLIRWRLHELGGAFDLQSFKRVVLILALGPEQGGDRCGPQRAYFLTPIKIANDILEYALEQKRQFGRRSLRVLLRQLQHRVLHDVERQMLVADREQCLLVSTALDFRQKIRKFGASSQLNCLRLGRNS